MPFPKLDHMTTLRIPTEEAISADNEIIVFEDTASIQHQQAWMS